MAITFDSHDLVKTLTFDHSCCVEKQVQEQKLTVEKEEYAAYYQIGCVVQQEEREQFDEEKEEYVVYFQIYSVALQEEKERVVEEKEGYVVYFQIYCAVQQEEKNQVYMQEKEWLMVEKPEQQQFALVLVEDCSLYAAADEYKYRMDYIVTNLNSNSFRTGA